jgi:hypothetical protein
MPAHTVVCTPGSGRRKWKDVTHSSVVALSPAFSGSVTADEKTMQFVGPAQPQHPMEDAM